MHIRIYGISASIPSKGPPPKQTRSIPGRQSKTPVAQMHFDSELPLSEDRHSINGCKMILQANPELILV
jgi:hypothetical protein